LYNRGNEREQQHVLAQIVGADPEGFEGFTETTKNQILVLRILWLAPQNTRKCTSMDSDFNYFRGTYILDPSQSGIISKHVLWKYG